MRSRKDGSPDRSRRRAIGLAHALPTPDETPSASSRMRCNPIWWPVDVLVMGHSHLEGVTRFGATLVVNPGSATLPRNLVDVPGTVAILEIGRWPHRRRNYPAWLTANLTTLS